MNSKFINIDKLPQCQSMSKKHRSYSLTEYLQFSTITHNLSLKDRISTEAKLVKFQGKVLTHKRTVTLLMDRISVFTSVISSWVAHRQNVKIGYFTAKRISDKQTNKRTVTLYIQIRNCQALSPSTILLRKIELLFTEF